MNNFEIHITGGNSIIEYCKKYYIDYLEIELLSPDLIKIDSHIMCSIKKEFNSYYDCFNYSIELISHMIQYKIEIKRLKIESSPNKEYLNKIKYIEYNSEVSPDEVIENKLPLSFIRNKNKLVITNRSYSLEDYESYIKSYNNVELCLYDSTEELDEYWMKLWKVK